MKKLLFTIAAVLLTAVNVFAEAEPTGCLTLTVDQGEAHLWAKVKFSNYGVPSNDFPHIEISLNGGDWDDPFVVNKFFDIELGNDGIWFGMFYVCDSFKTGDKLQIRGAVKSLDSYETGSIELVCVPEEVPLQITKSGNASSLFDGTGEGEEPATGNFLTSVERYYPHEHTYTKYTYDRNATYVADGTETAYCDHGCYMSDSRTVANTMQTFYFKAMGSNFVEIVLDGMGYKLVPSSDDVYYYYFGGPSATADSFEKAIKQKLSSANNEADFKSTFMNGEKTYSVPFFYASAQMNVFVSVVVWNESLNIAEAYKPTKLVYTPSAGNRQQVVARVGDVMYLSLEEAMNNLDEGKTLRILSDIDMGSTALTFDKNVTVDLNGHTLTSSNEDGTICASSTATVTVIGTGTIANTSERKVAYSSNVSVGDNIEVVTDGTPTAIDTIKVSPSTNKTIKTIQNGKVVIIKDSEKYDLMGRKL